MFINYLILLFIYFLILKKFFLIHLFIHLFIFPFLLSFFQINYFIIQSFHLILIINFLSIHLFNLPFLIIYFLTNYFRIQYFSKLQSCFSYFQFIILLILTLFAKNDFIIQLLSFKINTNLLFVCLFQVINSHFIIIKELVFVTN